MKQFYLLMRCVAAVLITVSAHAQTLTGQSSAPSSNLALWYRQPADHWMTTALPIGNGRIGAEVFGGVSR